MELDVALSNAMGLGGHNGCVCSAASPRPTCQRAPQSVALSHLADLVTFRTPEPFARITKTSALASSADSRRARERDPFPVRREPRREVLHRSAAGVRELRQSGAVGADV